MRDDLSLTTKLSDASDLAKRSLGKNYAPTMNAYATVLKARMKSDNSTELEAALELAKEAPPFAALCYIAAAVELIDPSFC